MNLQCASRATTCWSQGFSAAGVTSDIAMFAGNIKYRKSIYDTTGQPWPLFILASSIFSLSPCLFLAYINLFSHRFYEMPGILRRGQQRGYLFLFLSFNFLPLNYYDLIPLQHGRIKLNSSLH